MSFVRTTDELLEDDPMRWTDAEVDAAITWQAFRATLPAGVASGLPLAETLGLPDLERCVLALVSELADDRGVLTSPLDALGARLSMRDDGWTLALNDEPGPEGESARAAHIRLMGRAARAGVWLREPLRTLAGRGFLRVIRGGVLVTWRLS